MKNDEKMSILRINGERIVITMSYNIYEELKGNRASKISLEKTKTPSLTPQIGIIE